jgi:hypothetical protein
MRAVRVRKTIAVTLLLLATAMVPGLVWAGEHWLHYSEHRPEAGIARNLAEVLVHGHEHSEGTPDHDHNRLPTLAVRHDASLRHDASKSFQVSEAALPESPAVGPSSLPEISRTWQLPRLDGPSPPRLHLLCTLLI